MDETGLKQNKGDECLTDELQHRLELVGVEHGKQVFRCTWDCGYWEEVLEDSLP